MKKVIIFVLAVTMLMVGVASGEEMIDRDFITEYMETKAEELHCESLGCVDISHMNQEAFNEWCFSLFPYSEEEALSRVYVDILEEDVHGKWDIWLLIENDENKYIVTFYN